MNKNDLLQTFSPRQQEIIKMLVSEFDSKTICFRLGITKETLQVYVSNILKKSESFIDFDDSTSRKEQFIRYFQDESIEKLPPVPIPEQEPEEKDIKGNELWPSEQKVYNLLMDGKNYGQIAEELVLSPSTVKMHIAAIFQKKGVHSLPELIVDGYKKRLAMLQKEHPRVAAAPKADSIRTKIENRLQKAKDELAQTAQEAGFLALNRELITLEIQEKAEKLQLKINIYNEIIEEVTNV